MSQISPRQQDILQALASMLETQGGTRITTAALAKQVGVSEAALYRHFPSKTRMFETLIQFIEETVFSRINKILDDEKETVRRFQLILTLLLTFAEKNPGMCHILIGDALTSEADSLRERITRFYDRFESQLKQILRESEIRQDAGFSMDASAIVTMLMAIVEGRIAQYVRSQYLRKPTDYWNQQWQLLESSLFTVDNLTV